jgi:hypothetical protein
MGMNRASPARLFKPDSLLSEDKKDLMEEWGVREACLR